MALQDYVLIDELGQDPVFTQVAVGDTFKNDGRTILMFQNTDVAAKNVIMNSQVVAGSVFSGFGTMSKSNRMYVVPANGFRMAGPFPTQGFNNASGEAALTYTTGVTGLKIAVIRIP